MTEYFLKLMSDSKPQIQEPQRTPSRINAKKTIPKHIFKLQKSEVKKITEEASRKKRAYIIKLKEVVIGYTERKN